jgi:nonsense-mediated mRNA decay protein 3
MPSGEFCVVCGRTGLELTDGVCAACAADRTSLVSLPVQVEIVLCPQCGARWTHGRWGGGGASTVVSSDDLAPFLTVHPEVGIRSLRWEERARSGSLRELLGRATIRFRGLERTVPLGVRVRVVARSCTACGRRSGRYYTARLQLRGEAAPRVSRPKELRRRLEALWGELASEARSDWRAAVGWSEELPEGWDVYFTDTAAARSVARLAKLRYGAPIVESASLFGRKNGQDVYRVTFCLRFPPEVLGTAGDAAGAPPPRSWNDSLKKRPRRRTAERVRSTA